MDRTCGMCGLKNATKCLVLGTSIDPKNPACIYYDSNPFCCEICGQVISKTQTIIHTDNLGGLFHITCVKCADRIASCAGCKKNEDCRFETDPSPIPQYIQQRVQQGGMTMMGQIKNPDRIAITCEDGCPCWNVEDRTCNRNAGICGGYVCLWD